MFAEIISFKSREGIMPPYRDMKHAVAVYGVIAPLTLKQESLSLEVPDNISALNRHLRSKPLLLVFLPLSFLHLLEVI